MRIKSFSDVKRDKVLTPYFEDFARKTGIWEMYLFALKPGQAAEVYDAHLAEGAGNTVKIPSKICAQAQKLYMLLGTKFIMPGGSEAEVKRQIFARKEWATVLVAAQKDRVAHIEKVHLPAFRKSDQFKEYFALAYAIDSKKLGVDIGMAGADDKLVRQVAVHLALDEKAKALGVAKDMLTAFKKKGKRTAKGDVPADHKEVVARLSKKVEKV
ncbi:MAG: hypothetical protein AAFR79_10505 [Pseudomonadota bacterium]